MIADRRYLPEVLLATSFAVSRTIATPTIRRAAGTTLVLLGITVPALVFASANVATRVVFREEDFVALDVTGQSSWARLEDGIICSNTCIGSKLRAELVMDDTGRI